ncbi:hypothetical protein XAC3562_1200052 [Xanthomonas citri pv. citri]|uniref:Uncharacterized protein n=1 Tax=Xanthomonas citri pv. citri TaxID=611301 RepID=A0A0U5F8J1_XANCI|nr:hypothetical protein XAC3608_2050014 [Xanthomonas citri pv. citri]CEG14729.1 hypothetical protein XAC3562_1200052 [Xanthomonas citri pv. citri]
MSLTLSAAILKTTKHTSLDGLRATVDNRRHAGDDAEYAVDTTRLDDAGLQELAAAAEKHGDGKAARAIEAIRLARSGDFAKAVPSFKAFAGILHEFLTTDIIDGWIYVVGQDGNYYPELVTDIHFDAGISGRGKAYPTVTIKTSYYGRTETGYRETFGSARGSHVFSAQRSRQAPRRRRAGRRWRLQGDTGPQGGIRGVDAPLRGRGRARLRRTVQGQWHPVRLRGGQLQASYRRAAPAARHPRHGRVLLWHESRFRGIAPLR